MSVPEAPFSATAAGTNDGASAAKAAKANSTHIVTEISGHVDEDAAVTITDGGTIAWESLIDVSVEGFSFSFPGLNVVCSVNAIAAGVIANSNANCQVNISGYTR